MSLRNDIIKLAYSHPTLRGDLLPLVSGQTKTAAFDELAKALIVNLAPFVAPLQALGAGVVNQIKNLLRKPVLTEVDEAVLQNKKKELEKELEKTRKKIPAGIVAQLDRMKLPQKIIEVKKQVTKRGSWMMPLPVPEMRSSPPILLYLGLSAIVELLAKVLGSGKMAAQEEILCEKAIRLAYEKPLLRDDLVPLIQRHKNATIIGDFVKMMPHWVRGTSMLARYLWQIHNARTLAEKEEATEKALEIAEHYADGVAGLLTPAEKNSFNRMDMRGLAGAIKSLDMLRMAQAKKIDNPRAEYALARLVVLFLEDYLQKLRSGKLIRLGFDIGSIMPFMQQIMDVVMQFLGLLQGVPLDLKQGFLKMVIYAAKYYYHVAAFLIWALVDFMSGGYFKERLQAALTQIKSIKDRVKKKITRDDAEKIEKMPLKEEMAVWKKPKMDETYWTSLMMHKLASGDEKALRDYIMLDALEKFVRQHIMGLRAKKTAENPQELLER